MKKINYYIIFIIFNCFCFFIQAKSNINPWANDPLANVNLFTNINNNTNINTNTKQCLMPNTCPICDITEEWPLDLNGDDLAEKVQKRTCLINYSQVNLHNISSSLENNNNLPIEIIIIYDSQMKPLAYKANNINCGEDKQISFTNLQRTDLNSDNLDELFLVEHDHKTNSDQVKVLAYDFRENNIIKLPLADFTELLPEKSKNLKNLNNTNTKTEFLEIKQNNFVIAWTNEQNEKFKVSYYQDKADKKLYPLNISKLLNN